VLEADSGLSDLHWRGRGDAARTALVEGQIALRDRRAWLGGPVMVAVIWVRDGPDRVRRLSEFRDRVAGLPDDRAEWLLVLTNLDTAGTRMALQADATARDRRTVVLGSAEISASLDRDPRLRVAMPSVLGLRISPA